MLRFRSMVMAVVPSVQSEKMLYFIQLTRHLQLGIFIENVRHFSAYMFYTSVTVNQSGD